MSRTLRTLGKRVAVVMDPKVTSKGGIALPEYLQKTNTIGTVRLTGPDCEELAEGDRVHVPPHVGTHMVIAGVDHIVVDESKIPYKLTSE